jgi:site-specific DNA-methyltransferase (cytosine-N4-specific)
MPEYWTNGIATLYQSDARQIPIPDQSVHCVVTSPPYFGLRVYRSDSDAMIGLEETVQGYVDSMLEVMAEVGRVLRDDGVLWVNLGDSYGHGTTAVRQESGADKQNTNAGANINQRNGGEPGQLLMIPARFALAMQDAGWILRSDVIWAKKSCMPESLNGTRWEGDTLRRGSWRCTSSHEHIFQFVKGMGYYSDGEAVKTESNANRRNVWSDISPEPYGGEHYATFPSDLPQLCIQASTSEAGVCTDCGSQWARVVDATEWRPTCTCNADKVPATVLDPFAGTGTTLLAAMRLGRRSVGVDLSTDYLGQAVKRLEKQSLPMLI